MPETKQEQKEILNDPILPKITSPEQVQSLSLNELEKLAQEIRKEIISVVSLTGGHLAPSLGAVELTLALLKSYNPDNDKIIWDVGHQAYAYKILTRGLEKFKTLRTLSGISGFPRLQESKYDHFGVGHSSTSISAALGLALARDLKQEEHKVLAVIGDGSMTAGLAYEGLNQAGDLDRDLVVILNDNEMSISKNVGALSSFLSRKLTEQRYLRFKEDLKSRLLQVPKIGEDLLHYAKKSEESLKNIFTPGILFEAFKFNYLGPINGHNLRQLNKVFEQIKDIQGPVLVHALTTKGKGYPPAENNPTYFHGVGCFEPETGKSKKSGAGKGLGYSKAFGQTMSSLAEKDQRIVAITAAMPEGTGLAQFKESFPERFFDVGICEQHAVTFAAGLAIKGLRPVVSIYSTFLQRSYDQIVHDVCLQNLGVLFCLDRAGLVGEDGATHHGAFDLSYLRHIPNLTLMAPKDEAELAQMILTGIELETPAAIRYPRGCGTANEIPSQPKPLPIGQGELLKPGSQAVVLALGSRVYPSLQAISELEKESGYEIALFNSRFVKPLPKEQILELAEKQNKILIVEENVLAGGFGSAVLELLADQLALNGLKIERIGIPDQFIGHGSPEELRRLAGIDKESIKNRLLTLCKD